MKKTRGILRVLLTLVLLVAVVMTTSVQADAKKKKKTQVNMAQYTAVFDANYYAAKYPDLQTSVGTDAQKLFNHFYNSGMAEGRQGSEEFNVQAYMTRYPDLYAVYGNDLKQYYIHYVTSGKAEGRNGRATGSAAIPTTRSVVTLIPDGHPEFIDRLRTSINMLSEDVKSVLKDFTITIYDDDMSIENKLGWSAYGTTNVARKTIYVESICYEGIDEYYINQGYDVNGLNDTELSYVFVQNIMYHEVGHVVDSINGYPSWSASFINIYNAERASLLKTDYYNVLYNSDSVCLDDAEEYFASCYAIYIENPAVLLNNCPQTYGYMSSLAIK